MCFVLWGANMIYLSLAAGWGTSKELCLPTKSDDCQVLDVHDVIKLVLPKPSQALKLQIMVRSVHSL